MKSYHLAGSSHQRKQGWIHGYPSCMRVDRGGDKKGFPSIWVREIMQKPPVITKKAKCDGPTDQPTNQQTNKPTNQWTL